MKKNKDPLVFADRSIRRKVETIKRQKIVGKKVVSLAEYRQLQVTETHKSILVVDDDEIMRSGLKRILEAEGYQVALAVDGLELSKTLENTRLDLILLDVNLPWVDGYELCRMLKDHPVLKQVPLILVSARKSKIDIETGFAAGCDDYITKPFDVEYINQVIHKMLAKAL